MERQGEDRITVAVYAPATAFSPGTQNALVRLGYNLMRPRTAETENPLLRPQIRIVDDRQLDQVPLEHDLPMVLLTSTEHPDTVDARAVGTVPRQARLRALYEILQRVLEDHPRAVPRVDDAIPARATRDGHHWMGAIRSISEKGCLLQSFAELPSDLRVDLAFPLANRGNVTVPAQPSYRDGRLTGLVFRGTTETTRAAIGDYVASRLSS